MNMWFFIYDGAPAYNNAAIPGPNSELKRLPPYCPFLNIVEQTISVLKAAITANISRPERQEKMNNRAEARRQGSALGNYRTQLLHQALQRNIGTITAAKCGQWYRFMQTYIPRCLNNEEIEGKLQNITLQYTVIEQFWNFFFPSWLLLLHTCLSVHVNDWPYRINDCMKVQLNVRLYANCIIECL